MLVPIVCAAGVTFATNAAAEQPPTAAALSGGARVLYGFWAGSETGGINPYGVGLGLNAGYTFDVGLHLGAAFQYFFGGSDETSANDTLSLDLRQLLGVAGYDIGLSRELVLRPQIGLGVIWTSSESCQPTGCFSDSANHFVASPGLEALYVIEPLYSSAGAAYNRVFTEIDDADGVLLGASVGALW